MILRTSELVGNLTNATVFQVGSVVADFPLEQEGKQIVINVVTPLERKEAAALAIFEARFSRSRKLLAFIASRVLGECDDIEKALENCWLTASRNPPSFEHEGAFRSWLVRVLIDEALIILRERANSRNKHVTRGSGSTKRSH